MTRSTASVSWPPICASVSSGTAGSPRRSWSSSRCAFSIARSPPLAATYMSNAPVDDARRARQCRDLRFGRKQQIDAARKQPRIGSEPLRQVVGSWFDAQLVFAADAGPAQQQATPGAKVVDLQHDGGRAVR